MFPGLTAEMAAALVRSRPSARKLTPTPAFGGVGCAATPPKTPACGLQDGRPHVAECQGGEGRTQCLCAEKPFRLGLECVIPIFMM